MPPKKGLTGEEKLLLLLKWFQSDHSFYTLKEIEQKASKACKIPSMQIKELVVNLVNEGWIEQEKCGTTNLYWSFEYSQYKRKAQIYNQLKQSIVNLEQEKDRLSSHFGNVTGERNESNNREHNLVQYQKLKSMVDEVDEKLQSTKEVEMMEELKSSIEFFTDSIEIVISFFSHQSGTSVSVLKTEFEIPLEFDDLPELSSEFMR